MEIDDQAIFFFYHSDLELPKKILNVLSETRKQGNSETIPVLVLKTDKGEIIEITFRTARVRFFEKFKKRFLDMRTNYLLKGRI